MFHVASPKDVAPEPLLHRTNVNGTRNLLKAARETESTCAFIYTGSDSAFEQMPGVKQTEEISKLYTERSKGANPYAKTKAIADAEDAGCEHSTHADHRCRTHPWNIW